MRHIGIVTTSRADYSIYRPLLKLIHKSKTMKIFLYVSGTHLSHKHGLTINEIKKDRFPIKEKIKINLNADDASGVARAMGEAVLGFGKAFSKSRPDLLIVLGDRYEMHAAVSASIPFLIPIAHISGGVKTEGAIDDSFRHSITKMSHLHFVETKDFARRIVQLGEQPNRVNTVGSMGLDNIRDLPLLSWSDLKQKFKLTCGENPIVVTLHAETKDPKKSLQMAKNLLIVLNKIKAPVIFTGPNADPLGMKLKSLILGYVKKNSNSNFVESFGAQGYYSLLKTASVAAGNSSSAIIEAPSFALPVVNIGDRQKGRLFAKNIIPVGVSLSHISHGFKKAMSAGFKSSLKNMNNPYGDGRTAPKIFKEIKKVKLDKYLLLKPFYDLRTKN